MQVRILRCEYVEGEKVKVQGNAEEVRSYEDKGFRKKRGGRGTFLMEKPADAEIHYELNGEEYVDYEKDLIKDYYNKKRISNSLTKKFEKECLSGKVNVEAEKDKIISITKA